MIKKRHDNLKTRPNYKGKNKHYDSCSVAYERMSTQLLWKPHKNANFLKTSQFNVEFCYLDWYFCALKCKSLYKKNIYKFKGTKMIIYIQSSHNYNHINPDLIATFRTNSKLWNTRLVASLQLMYSFWSQKNKVKSNSMHKTLYRRNIRIAVHMQDWVNLRISPLMSVSSKTLKKSPWYIFIP